MSVSRRTLIGGGAAAAGLATLPFLVDGELKHLLPGQARERGADYWTLTPAQVRALEAFGEALLPGAAAAGIAHFVDRHVSVPAAESLLMVRYLDVPPPYDAFYAGALAALDGHSRRTRDQDFADLSAERQVAFVREIAAASPAGWEGPPSPLVYFTIRSDAVDVVYGTEEGFAKLGVPYMAHIAPPKTW